MGARDLGLELETLQTSGLGAAPQYAARDCPPADVTGVDEKVDFRDRSLELTRRARALKLWLSFGIYGVERISAAIARGIALAEHAERVVAGESQYICPGEPRRIAPAV